MKLRMHVKIFLKNNNIFKLLLWICFKTYEISSETMKTHASRLEVACRNLMGAIKLYVSPTQNRQGTVLNLFWITWVQLQ